MSLSTEYLSWIRRLGWVTRPMLTTLTRTTDPGKDKNLDKYLCQWLREGKVRRVQMGKRSVYFLPRYKTGRQPNVVHGMLSAQAIVYLWSQFPDRERLIVSSSDFAKESLGIIPDFGLVVKFGNGHHLFLLEFQSQDEAGRSTLKKLDTYWTQLEDFKYLFSTQAVWVIVVARKERLWVEQFARKSSYNFVYFIDSKTYFAEPCVATAPIFFTAGGQPAALVE